MQNCHPLLVPAALAAHDNTPQHQQAASQAGITPALPGACLQMTTAESTPMQTGSVTRVIPLGWTPLSALTCNNKQCYNMMIML